MPKEIGKIDGLKRRSVRTTSVMPSGPTISSFEADAETGDDEKQQSVRRSKRKVTPNKRLANEYMYYTRCDNRMRSPETSDNSDEDETATTLFDVNEDVAGSEIYSFKTPKKRNGMEMLATNTPKTPKLSTAIRDLSIASPRTPSSNKRTLNIEKTPHQERDRLKKNYKQCLTNDESDEDFSADEDSIYSPSSQSDNASSSEASESEEESEKESGNSTRRGLKMNLKLPAANKVAPVTPSRNRSTRLQQRLQQANDCLPESDNYFNSQSKKKLKTSNHTLERLKNSRLQHDDLLTLLKSIKISKCHMEKTQELNQDYEESFGKWMTSFSKGFNVIVYGLGSKQHLIHKFCQMQLFNRPTMVVNGFFPTLIVKDILTSISTDILNTKVSQRNNHEVVDAISAAFKSSPKTHLFLIIHNLDGPMIRKTKDQHIISRLAKIPNIHLLASIDHINAPMMWDQTCISNFNFLWWDCTTMLPYKNETAFENSSFMKNSGELGLAAMTNVFQSLTKNSKGIFMLLVTNQLKNQKDTSYQGMAFKDLYHECRENFLVNSDSVLRTQLTEFIDHNMVRNKRSVDGTEYLVIPIDRHILEQFSEQIG